VGASRVAQASAAPQPAAGGTPGGPDGGRFVPVPPTPGVDPLALATTRASCDAAAQAQAAPLLANLRAYVTAYEAKTKVPDLTSYDVTPHVVTVDPSVPYYLELRPKRPAGAPATGGAAGATAPGTPRVGGLGGVGGPGGGGPGGPGGAAGRPGGGAGAGGRGLRGIGGCAYVTVLSSDDAKAKGIVTQGGRPGLFYVPKLGLVFVRPPELPQGGGSLRGNAPPTTSNNS